MSHLHIIHDSDAHFTIDPITRAIINESKKTTVIQHDHNSEKFTFAIPKVEGHDMSACNRVEIHYINIDATDKTKKATGVYEADDLKTSSDDSGKVTFSWLLSRNATQYAGSLNFLIRFACITDGVEEYAWNTAIFQSITVGSGMYNGGEEVIEPYLDVIAQWKNDLFGVGDTQEQRLLTVSAEQQAAIAAKGAAVLDSIPDEYEALQTGVDTLFNSVASGIGGNLSGAVVRADDVSPVEHETVVKVRGKNLFTTETIEVVTESKDGVYVSAVGEGTITITSPEAYVGNGFRGLNRTLRELCPQIIAGKEYVLNAVSPSNVKAIFLVGRSVVWPFGTSKILTEDLINCSVVFYGYDSTIHGSGDCVISEIQIEEGTTATEYTPYIDPETVRVVKCGKNLITNLGKSIEGTGIEWTKNEDGTVVANGTAETDCVYGFDVIGWKTGLVGSTVTLSGCPSGGAIEKFAVVQRNYGRFDTGSGVTFVIDNQNFSAWGVKVEAGVTVNNLVFKPQLEIGNIATEYEQHKIPTDYTPGADGVVSGVTSVYPTMTIMTNTPGVTVDCEYIVDTKTYIDNKIAEALKGRELA